MGRVQRSPRSRREHLVVGVKVEGLGRGDTNKRYRWSTDLLYNDPESLYIPSITLEGMPGEIESTVNWRDNGKGRSTIGGIAFTLKASTAVLNAFGDGGFPAKIGDLEQLLTNPTETQIRIQQVDPDANLSGKTINVGREAIYLESITAQTIHASTYQGVRGRLGTTAKAHKDRAVFFAHENPFPTRRQVELFAVRKNEGYDEERTLRRFILNSISQPSPETLQIEADSALELLWDTKILDDLWSAEPTLSPNRQPEDTVTYTGEEGEHPSTINDGINGSNQCLFFTGDSVFRSSWSTLQSRVNTQIRADSEVFADSNPFDLSKPPKKIWETFSTDPRAPNLNNSTDPRNQRLSANPIEFLLQIITTTQSLTPGTPGDNGPYDLGIGQLGCAIPFDLLDMESMEEAIRQTQATMTGMHLDLKKGVEAGKILIPMLRYYGFALTQDAQGRISIDRMRAVPRGTEAHIYDSDMKEPPRQSKRLHDPISRINLEYGHRPGKDPQKTKIESPVLAERYAGTGATEDIAMKGLRSKEEAESLATREMNIWRSPYTEWELVLKLTEKAEEIREGDLVLVTSKSLTGGRNSKGDVQRGVDSTACIVLSASFSHIQAEAYIRLLWIGAAGIRAGLIGPGALVTSWGQGGGESHVTITPETFSQTKLPEQTDDLFGFHPGQVIQIRSRDRETLRGTATLTSIDQDNLRLKFDHTFTGLESGDIVRLAPYALQPEQVRKEYAFFSNIGGVMEDGSPAYAWGW